MKRPAAKIVLFVLSLTLGLVGAEWLVRAFPIGPDLFSIQRGMIRLSPDPRLRFELVPDYISPRMDVMVNRWGMRNRPVAQEKEPGSLRIACIGDSIAFGMGAGQDDHFSPHLQSLLHDRSPNRHHDVLNFGVPGYNIDQVAAVLEQRVGHVDPDLVLYLYCLNDVQEASRELESLLRDEESGNARRDYVQRLWSASDSALGGSKLWMLTRYFIASWRVVPSPSVEPYRDEVDRLLAGEGKAYFHDLYQRPESRRRLEAGLQAVAEWQRQADVPVWLVVFPVFSLLDDDSISAIHDEVRLAAESRGLMVIDLLDLYRDANQRDGTPLHADPLHPNARGYARAADHVEPFLRKALP